MVVHQDVGVEYDGERAEIVLKLADKSSAIVIESIGDAPLLIARTL